VELTAYEVLKRKKVIKPSQKRAGHVFCKWHPPFLPERWMDLMENHPEFRKNALDALANCGPLGYTDFASDDGPAPEDEM
jgi:hypothetical protein